MQVSKTANVDADSVSLESTRLSQAFWQSVTLHDDNDSISSSGVPVSAVDSLESFHTPSIMFGNEDGSLWSPSPHRKEQLSVDMEMSILSPAQRIAFSKSMVASPSPNDPFAAFPSFSVALMGVSGGAIAYPPRALVG